MSNERDLHLLRRIIERDRTSLTELYLAYRPRLTRFLRRKTSQHDLIESAINETLWIVWQKSVRFRGRSRVSTWILGIAQRCTLNLLRKSAALLPMPETEEALAPDEFLFDENWQWLDRAMEELPREQRTALELCYIGGHSCEEIAAIMHCPVNTVKTRMFHARINLRQSLPRLAEATHARDAWGAAASDPTPPFSISIGVHASVETCQRKVGVSGSSGLSPRDHDLPVRLYNNRRHAFM